MLRYVPIVLAVLVALAAATPTRAQESASFKLKEHAFNAGGHPNQGTVFESASFRVSLDAVGDAVHGPTLSSSSFRVDGGFVAAYPPPGEVSELVFSAPTELAWNGGRAFVRFNLYRGELAAPPGDFGACLQPSLAAQSTTDVATPSAGVAWLYLVTGRNRLHEEGTKGSGSDGVERPNPAPCP